MGDEFGPVVAADERWGWVEAGELLQHRHDVFGLAAPAHPDGQAETAVLVDHVEELEPPAIGRGVELEVHRPDLVRVLSLVTSHRAVSRSCPLLLAGGGPLEALLAPEPVHPLVVYRPAFSPQQAVGHAPAPADVLSCDLAETMPQLGLLKIDDLADMALAAAVLAHQSADPPLGCPVTLLQDCDGPPATLRAQKFPSARSLSIALSSSASARSLLSRAFSFSSWLSRLASSAFIPP